MTEELDILKIVAENPSISQRKIADKTGISLGQVNFLIKKFVKKGLIKIEGQTSKSIKYNLTPKGFAEKASLTLEYIKISYSAVAALSNKIQTLSKEYDNRDAKIYIYGSNDEMMEIVRIVLNDNRIFWLEWSNEAKVIVDSSEKNSNYIIFCWETLLKEELERSAYKVINVLE